MIISSKGPFITLDDAVAAPTFVTVYVGVFVLSANVVVTVALLATAIGTPTKLLSTSTAPVPELSSNFSTGLPPLNSSSAPGPVTYVICVVSPNVLS